MPNLKRALLFVWRSAPGCSIAKATLMTAQGLLPLVLLYLTKLVVDAVSTSLSIPDKGAIFNQVVLLLGLAGAVTLAVTLCNSLAGPINTILSQRVTDYMEGILHTKSTEIDLEYYEDARYYDTLQRAQQEASSRPTQILNRLTEVGQNGISLVAIIGLLLSLHWGIAGILFVVAIPSMLVRLKYARIAYHWEREQTPVSRRARYFSSLLTGDKAAKEIRLFNLGNLFSQRFRHLRQQLYQERLAITTRSSVAKLGAQVIAELVMFAAYGFIIYQTIHSVFTLGDLVLYHQAFKRGQSAFQGLLSGLSSLYEESLFLANLYEFLDIKPKVIEPLHSKPFPQPMQAGIVFSHVSFKYANTTQEALQDVNLTIKPGETIALVGENGSGKTTLIKLLCRLYDPTDGSITIDGIDLHQFEIANLRREISVIFQDYVKYHLTFRENIWLGNIDLPSDCENITKAAYRSGADKVIKNLPQGYDTMLGKLFDQGKELSIGQWQKVALARAFLRDAQVIILDEPTSAMDAKAEYEVFKNFRKLIKDRTAILISHRLSTVKMANCIYVLEDGRIVESGTHDELVQLGKTYAHLFETQAQHYR